VNPFELLREQVDVAEVVARFTDLKRVGRIRRGNCPLRGHDDTSPSFYVYDDHAHCYGCGFHGDAVGLWAALRGFDSQIEAALDLAQAYNVTLPERDPEAQQKAAERRQKEDQLAGQAKECHGALARHPRVAEWWNGRGFDEGLQKQFLLGANHDGTSAVIPFWNRGRAQGLIRRQLDLKPKYLLPAAENLPDGYKPLFILKATTDFFFVVEGYVDALACAALGFSSVAVGGTGISERQKEDLLRLKAQLFILPDADEEGVKASSAWVRELYPQARLCLAEYGEGLKDVADLFAAGGETAKAILEGLKARAVDALDLALSSVPKGSARESYRYFRDEVLTLLLKIEDEGERHAAADDAAKKLGMKSADVRRALKPAADSDGEANDNCTELVLHEPEPWAETVDGALLLDEITATVRRFLSAPEHSFKAVALWVLYAYAFDLFDTSPLLAIVSPEKRCGKTSLLTLLYALVPRPLAIANITAAALFRTVEKYQPVLLIDEADSFLTDNEELRGILNSGHRKATAYVIRTTGDEHEPRRFTTWTPKAVALIGALPGTLEDRAVTIRLERKRSQDSTERLRFDGLGEFEHLRQRAVRWVEDRKDELRAADPDISPEITNDRARDNWRPLLAIADVAGGEWSTRAREVALSYSSAEPDTESIKVLLLRDLRELFGESVERLESEKIVTALVEIEGRPWAEGKNGRPLTKTGLAKLLRPFGVVPQKWRDRTLGVVRGYHRRDFDEVFARYLDFETPQTPHATDSTTYGESQTPQDNNSVAFDDTPNPNEINDVAFVAFGNREEPEMEEVLI
jgi:putative DNA primase/helicase